MDFSIGKGECALRLIIKKSDETHQFAMISREQAWHKQSRQVLVRGCGLFPIFIRAAIHGTQIKGGGATIRREV